MVLDDPRIDAAIDLMLAVSDKSRIAEENGEQYNENVEELRAVSIVMTAGGEENLEFDYSYAWDGESFQLLRAAPATEIGRKYSPTFWRSRTDRE